MREAPRPMRAAIAPQVSNPRHDTSVGRVAHLRKVAQPRPVGPTPGRAIILLKVLSVSYVQAGRFRGFHIRKLPTQDRLSLISYVQRTPAFCFVHKKTACIRPGQSEGPKRDVPARVTGP